MVELGEEPEEGLLQQRQHLVGIGQMYHEAA